ncbi:AzlC family ABC transporter permease [Roseiterribacter gracilis]|uniref:Branched-chain amino acid permease n=1 Tax=Roseiterribacter gracilis TaxID=2812848 RepID=A0A8S8X859_9PROT|nr:branched-chain amino acid permease [Rhodospirillales bacterium TMPK1]
MNMQPPAPPTASDVTFTRAGIVAGLIAGQTLAAGVLVYGIVFGVLASEAKLTALEALLMSGSIYSGTAQMAALQGWAHTRLLLPAIATILIMNARYVLYGAALRPWLGTLPAHVTYPTLFFLGDGNWALSMQRRASGEVDAGFVFGSGVVMFVPWLVGTAIGVLVGSAIPDPARFGLDFMLVAFSMALAVSVWRGRSDLRAAGAALVAALVVNNFFPGGWTIVIAGLTGALVAYVTFDGEART